MFIIKENFYNYNDKIYTFDVKGTKIQEGGYRVVSNTKTELIYDYVVALPQNGEIVNRFLTYKNGIRYPVFKNEREICLNTKTCNNRIYAMIFRIDYLKGCVLSFDIYIINKKNIVNIYIDDGYNNLELSLERELLDIIKNNYNLDYKLNKSLTNLSIVESLLEKLRINYSI